MSQTGRGPDRLSWLYILLVITRHGGEATTSQLEDEAGYSRRCLALTLRRLQAARIVTRAMECRGSRWQAVYRRGAELRPLLDGIDEGTGALPMSQSS